MENREEFERFAVLYWGQEVATIENYEEREESNGTIRWVDYSGHIINGDSLIHIDYLELRSTDTLTNKELDIIDKSKKPGFRDYFKIAIKKDCYLYQFNTDCLRKWGVAIPFMQHSVDDMIKMGWVKIKKY